jgi:glycosyltransferase involved in cell wall biosynthesis
MEGRLKAPILGVCHAPVNTMFQSLPPEKVISFVCISEDQGEHFRNLFGRDCRVCYNGIDPMFYRPLGIPRSKRFLFLARFSTIKGPDIAIEACREAGVGLDLVGDTQITNEPDFLQKCQRMCDWSDSIEGRSPSLVCRDTIRMVGPATRSECVWWFSQAHALLHPNQRFREPFGLAPVESMACGTPVIAWDHGAMRETVRSGETGWLVNNFQDLVEAIKNARDGSTWELMRPAAREQACKFSVRRMVERYERLCHEAIKNPW